jgi:hypothetical protein
VSLFLYQSRDSKESSRMTRVMGVSGVKKCVKALGTEKDCDRE